ncbi:hypothetical protein RhiJN_23907 [Ceratobasidium sp. AG-Ba]|nr:hypothetical protein RhiJN_23907 [Ceratobasidium sp. AG-Ba]
MLEFMVILMLALFGSTTAQLSILPSLSQPCNQALGQLFTPGSPAANCLNTVGLLNILTTSSGQSYVPSCDAYLKATCSQPACTTETANAIINSITEGCSSDLLARNWSPEQLNSLLQDKFKYYNATRQVFCLRDTTSNQLCITTTMSMIEQMKGEPLNAGTVVSEIPQVLRNHNITVPKNISCTQCTQAAYTIARANLPSESSVKSWDTFWINQCGDNFISENIPTSIAQTANQTTESPVPSNALPTIAVPPLGMLFGSLALTLVSMLSIVTRG